MVNIRKARLKDVPLMLPLLEEYARQAEILPRTEDDVYRTIREWVVAESETTVVGMGSLLVMWHNMAEIRSLVVNPKFHGQGIGKKIVTLLMEEAQELRLKTVFALTRKPAFFFKLGFSLTQIEKLPRKVKHDCVFCPKFHVCDEVAVITHLSKKTDGPVQQVSAPVTGNGPVSNLTIPVSAGVKRKG